MAQVATRVAPASKVYKTRKPKAPWRRWVGAILLLVCTVAVFYHAIIVLRIFKLKHANPVTTALIEDRIAAANAEGRPVKRQQAWVPYDKISPNLVRAVLSGEDSRFFDHSGFDWEEIQKAVEKDWEEKKFQRGASTISQQLAKNLFLSSSKNPLRKLHEALITWEMEKILGKRRILELYLNVIEWGDGVYGAEAAAKEYFNVPASALAADQAAFLAAIIPNPNGAYNPHTHARKVARRQNLIERLMRHVVVPRDLA